MAVVADPQGILEAAEVTEGPGTRGVAVTADASV